MLAFVFEGLGFEKTHLKFKVSHRIFKQGLSVLLHLDNVVVVVQLLAQELHELFPFLKF